MASRARNRRLACERERNIKILNNTFSEAKCQNVHGAMLPYGCAVSLGDIAYTSLKARSNEHARNDVTLCV